MTQEGRLSVDRHRVPSDHADVRSGKWSSGLERPLPYQHIGADHHQYGDGAAVMKRLIADAFPSRRFCSISRIRGLCRAKRATISAVPSSQPLATTMTLRSGPSRPVARECLDRVGDVGLFVVGHDPDGAVHGPIVEPRFPAGFQGYSAPGASPGGRSAEPCARPVHLARRARSWRSRAPGSGTPARARRRESVLASFAGQILVVLARPVHVHAAGDAIPFSSGVSAPHFGHRIVGRDCPSALQRGSRRVPPHYSRSG